MTSLMMSSCWTFRLKRRTAFSRGSPSCNRTSAKLNNTSRLSLMDKCEFCSPFKASQALSYVNLYLSSIPGGIFWRSKQIFDREMPGIPGESNSDSRRLNGRSYWQISLLFSTALPQSPRRFIRFQHGWNGLDAGLFDSLLKLFNRFMGVITMLDLVQSVQPV